MALPAKRTVSIKEDTYADTAEAMGICVVGNCPVILWGPPGNGKTSVVKGIGKNLKMYVETVIPSNYQPSDFNGMPYVNEVENAMTLFAPAWAKRVKAVAEGPGKPGAIVFYDEISTASEAVQAAMLRPILEGMVGELELPRTVRTIAAANPPHQAAGGWDLSPPQANRFVHLNWELTAEVIRLGFSGHWPEIPITVPDPVAVKAEFTRLLSLIGVFIGSRPDLATVVPDSAEEAGRAWPSPRSWETLAKVWAIANVLGSSESVVATLARGTVGRAAANEVMSYVANLDLPDPEVLLVNPEAFEVPERRSDIVFAVCSSIEVALMNNLTGTRWSNAGEVLRKIAASGHQDIAVVYGNKWLDMRPDGVMPSLEVMQTLAPILSKMGLLAPA